MKQFSKKDKVSIIKYLIIGLILSLMFMGDVFSGGLSSKELSIALSNAFFVPAILLIGFALLSLISSAGGFYSVQYLGYSLRYTFGPRKADLEKKNKDYFTFCEEKKAEDAKKGSHRTTFLMLFVGLFYLIVCIILAAIFYLL